MVTSVNSGSSSVQPAAQQSRDAERLQQAKADQQQANQAEQARQQQAERQAQARQAQQNQENRKPPTPTVNTQGQTTGSIVNTTA